MEQIKRKLIRLIKAQTKGAKINQFNIKEFTNSDGDILPVSWYTIFKIVSVHTYYPSRVITIKLLDYFKEPYHIKNGLVKIGPEKTGKDETQI